MHSKRKGGSKGGSSECEYGKGKGKGGGEGYEGAVETADRASLVAPRLRLTMTMELYPATAIAVVKARAKGESLIGRIVHMRLCNRGLRQRDISTTGGSCR